MIQQKIYFTDATYNRMYEDGYLGNANIIFEKALQRGEIFDIGKQKHFYIVDEDLKQRIDKAIEYLEDHTYNKNGECGYTSDWDVRELYDILKGKEDEEN